MGWWKKRNFTLYVSGKVRWEIGRIKEDRFSLSVLKWKTSIPRVQRMIGNINIQKWVFTRWNRTRIIMEDVKIKQTRCKQKEVILHCSLFFRFPHMLIKNDITYWLFNTNYVQKLILVNITCEISDRWTQKTNILRIKGTKVLRMRI